MSHSLPWQGCTCKPSLVQIFLIHRETQSNRPHHKLFKCPHITICPSTANNLSVYSCSLNLRSTSTGMTTPPIPSFICLLLKPLSCQQWHLCLNTMFTCLLASWINIRLWVKPACNHSDHWCLGYVGMVLRWFQVQVPGFQSLRSSPAMSVGLSDSPAWEPDKKVSLWESKIFPGWWMMETETLSQTRWQGVVKHWSPCQIQVSKSNSHVSPSKGCTCWDATVQELLQLSGSAH